MNKNIKKIFTAALITTASATMIGCTSANNKLAKNIDKGMAEFVSSINNLDYVDTSNEKIGKIVETAAITNTLNDSYLTKTLEEIGADNDITLPNSRTDNFKLFVLADKPFITLSSSDDNLSLNMQLHFSTNKIEDTSEEINTKINNLILKRSILLIYVNEIYNNRVNLSEENRVAINAYVNVIKENASYLSGNRGMVKNQLTLANDLKNSKSNDNLVNYYMIKSGEALETRASKIDATISAIDSITKIIENNLDASSVYYNSSLSNVYEDIIGNLQNSNANSNTTNENKELAQNICNSLELCKNCETSQNKNTNLTQNQAVTLENRTNYIKNKTNTNNSNLTLQNKNSSHTANRKFVQPNRKSQNKIKNFNTETTNNLNKNQSKNNSQISEDNNYYSKLNQNKKSANFHQFNRNSTQVNQNDNNFNNNRFYDKPVTLDLPREEYQITNKNNSDTAQQNLDKNSYEINTNNSYKNQSKKKTNSNPEIKNGYENIKRVPYIRTLD